MIARPRSVESGAALDRHVSTGDSELFCLQNAVRSKCFRKECRVVERPHTFLGLKSRELRSYQDSVPAAAAEHALPIGPEVVRDGIHLWVVIGFNAGCCSLRHIGLTRSLAIRAMQRSLVDFPAHPPNMAVPLQEASPQVLKST
jgi:hypothetical protein